MQVSRELQRLLIHLERVHGFSEVDSDRAVATHEADHTPHPGWIPYEHAVSDLYHDIEGD